MLLGNSKDKQEQDGTREGLTTGATGGPLEYCWGLCYFSSVFFFPRCLGWLVGRMSGRWAGRQAGSGEPEVAGRNGWKRGF